MSNGYLAAFGADIEAAREVAEGFGLDFIDASTINDPETAVAALAEAANVGLVLSLAAAQDAAFVTLLQALAQRLARAQLILAEPEARAAFAFLPEAWPMMSLEDALARARAMVGDARQGEAPRPEPEQASTEGATEQQQQQQEVQSNEPDASSDLGGTEPGAESLASDERAEQSDDVGPPLEEDAAGQNQDSEKAAEAPVELDGRLAEKPEAPADTFAGVEPEAESSAPSPAPIEDFTLAAPEPQAPPAAPQPEQPVAVGAPPPAPSLPPAAERPEQGTQAPVRAPGALDTLQQIQEEGRRRADAILEARRRGDAASSRGGEADDEGPRRVGASEPPPTPMAPAPARKRDADTATRSASTPASAPADATAFAPKKLRRGTPELVRIAVHQPKDLQAVIKAARKIDPRAEPAPQGMSIGEVALGASVGIALEVRGATCDGALQRRTWAGEPIDFSFSVEAEDGARQAVLLARVFVDDAQIGVLAFTRSISGPAKKPASIGDRVRLKRHKRVFLSYSSKDRETVSAIATAYQMAGVQHFWDRTSLKSGEEWHPRLRREIDRADLFHLCWSKSAAASQWVEKETEHALSTRRRSGGKKPDITVQMLDGPPWAPHPPQLDSINFDDFVRAAIVGYARGEE
ncbi:MAG: toll/interleukin-1 receptor domain-containing protein [Terricaulis sp.]